MKLAFNRLAMPQKARSGAACLVSAAVLSLAACSSEADNPPGAVSEGEKQALEEAATMLDEQRVPVEAIAQTDAENENSASPELTGDGAPAPQP
ncbi:MAG: hypothetical protein AAGL10_06985 [Pseudomonadota bacterium]